MNGDQVAVILDINKDNAKEDEVEKPDEEHAELKLHWIHGTISLLIEFVQSSEFLKAKTFMMFIIC